MQAPAAGAALTVAVAALPELAIIMAAAAAIQSWMDFMSSPPIGAPASAGAPALAAVRKF